ncbi:MAG: hypothetical protein ACJA2E_000305 [Arenicella sp.]|jgi:hypothetical protein
MDYIFGYGSLVSRYSRQHYSNIMADVKVARIKGWCRAWCVSYPDEGATYAGAIRDDAASLNGVLIPTEIDQAIAERERGYQFTMLNLDDISSDISDVNLSQDDKIWICETLQVDTATAANPLPQSYVDTCISGCLESTGTEGAIEFIQQTQGWNCRWLNDRHFEATPRYPRFTPISTDQASLIDSLLDQQDVLKFRQS